ncbi:MAG: hypothetical protein JSV86_09030 [Gemmatimonadota bacterium]|nr:MAG: hypothetical protein JSV86_09030 [Gemmatimonadota bacterium]
MHQPGKFRRRYGDKEVGLVLKRAAELQREDPAGTAGGGLTLAELEEIAAEAGIDPQYLRRAADELDVGAADLEDEGAAVLAGAPLTARYERIIRGELPESEFELLVPEIQRTAEGHGQGSLLGHTFTWRSSAPQGERSLQVTVSSRDGRTHILIEERLHGLAGQLFGGIMGGVGGGVGLGVGLGVGVPLGSLAFSIAFPAAVIGGSWLLARAIFGSVARRRRRALRDLLDRITEHVEWAARPPELPGSQE